MEMLQKNNLLDKLEEGNLSLLGDAYNLYLLAQDDVEKNGLTITEDGKSRINPALSIMTKEQNIILAMLKDYGISARSRKKLLKNDSDENPNSPLSQFLDMVNNE